jgi:hypothetical protein
MYFHRHCGVRAGSPRSSTPRRRTASATRRTCRCVPCDVCV